MFFRNLTLFRFPVDLDLSGLNELLPDAALKPVGPLELSSRGFVPPYGDSREGWAGIYDQHCWVAVGGEDKILPVAAVNHELTKRLQVIEELEGRRPGARARKRIKDDVLHDMLPRALIRPTRTDAFLDERRGLLVVNTASMRVASEVASEIRRALGSFPTLPLYAEIAPRSVLTGWLAGEPLPAGLALGEECELKDPIECGAVIKCLRQHLGGDEITKHLESGKQVSRLALTLDDSMTFVIGDDLVVRKFALCDCELDKLESHENTDARAEQDARFLLMATAISRLFDVLETSFKLSRAGG